MNFNKQTFFDDFRPWYKRKTGKRTLSPAVANAVDFLLDSFMSNKEWKDIRYISYAFSTIFHETAATMAPIKEYRSKAGTKGRKNQDRYWLSGYFGRGYVQLTWDYNYLKAAKKLGQPLDKNPDLALRSDIAFQILTHGMLEGWFTGKKLSDYINSKTTDYKNARRIINGVDKAATLASYAKDFETMLKAALIPESKVKKTVDSKPISKPSSNPVDGVPNGQEPAEDVAEGEVKPGEAAPVDGAQQGEAIVGGRPDDPPKDVKAPEEESISGLRTWPTTIAATLSGAGLTVGGIITNLSGIELSEKAQVMVGWFMIMGVVIAAAYGLFYLYTRSKAKSEERTRSHEIQMAQLEAASRPDRYNVKSVG